MTAEDLNADAHRRELTARLVETMVAYHGMRAAPLPEIRSEALNAAFNAVADIGCFNRAWPELAIGKVPSGDDR